MSTEAYIGIMSGTSLDGVDVVLANIDATHCAIRAHYSMPFPCALKEELHALCSPGSNEIWRLGVIESKLASLYANAVNTLLLNQRLTSKDIVAIGCHGQTLRHHPDQGFSLQANNPAALAVHTGIPVVADFRRGDIALGGQGAPLVPNFHLYQFAQTQQNKAIINLGGIANVSVLQGEQLVCGFDTGPANLLLDSWCQLHTGNPYDNRGEWARSGNCLTTLLDQLLNDHYFSLPAPKSTGREYFHLAWLKQHLTGAEAAEDVQNTLTHLTAKTVAESLKNYAVTEVVACGGGAYNTFTLELLAHYLPEVTVHTSESYQLAPEHIEAAAFAWLAWARMHNLTGNATQATGASRPLVLGGLYLP